MLPDDRPAFSVNIQSTRTVDALKDAIKHKMTPVLNAFPARDLRLYQIDLDGSNRNYIKDVKRLAQKSNQEQELNPLTMLQKVITEPPDPRRERIRILVLPPACESLGPSMWYHYWICWD